MNVRMKLYSDTIFGNGNSIPGGEDIAVLCDENGFPYYKGSSFKGVFREEFSNYLSLCGKNKEESEKLLNEWLGFSGDDSLDDGKIIFSDFVISDAVKDIIMKEANGNPSLITDAFTNLRTFTALESNGIVKEGSLRIARCVNQGISFHSTIYCLKEQEETVKEVLSLIKWIGTMRNRGFGKVSIVPEMEGIWQNI